MATSFDSAQCVIDGDWNMPPVTCDPFPTLGLDKETLIGTAVGILVAASPIGGLVCRAVGGAVAGMAAAKLAKKYLKKEEDTE